MSAIHVPPLTAFSDWLRAQDPHAERHLDLLQRAVALLEGRGGTTERESQELAARLERWRYQHLNERFGQWSAGDWAFADALDAASVRLAGRAERPPRNPWGAVHGPEADHEAIRRGMAALEPEVPLEEVARQAAQLTRENFGASVAPARRAGNWRVLLYAPIYLSNECVNWCSYCGFRHPAPIGRRHLGLEEAVAQAEILAARGFRHLLLVAGDFPSRTTTEYYGQVIQALRHRGLTVALEIASQSTESYARLVGDGACGLTLYQETYDPELYPRYHPRGPKASYVWRLEAMDRAAEAGMHRLGLGILLGLADAREELRRLMRHARYLADRFPGRTLAFSLPRIHDAPPEFRVPCPVDDATFLRLYAALRIAFPQAELVLSTRENAALRNRLAGICVTQLSAGSSTAPGGYGESSAAGRAGQQFPVCDPRSVVEVAAYLRDAGFEPVWNVPVP